MNGNPTPFAPPGVAPLPLPGASRAEEDRFLRRAFKHHSRTFSLATRLLPVPVRGPVATLYLFCRTVDNVADEWTRKAGARDALARIERMSRSLYLTLIGQPPNELLWRRLAEVHETYGLPSEPLFELLEGAVWDIEERTVESVDDLLDYANRVAGSVGAMMLPFLVDDTANVAELRAQARALGQAMQITNVLRDVGEDRQGLDRVYLPIDLLDEAGLTVDDLRGELLTGPKKTAYISVLESLMDLADQMYLESIAGIAQLSAGAQLAINSAARMYREIHNEIRALGYDNLHHRAYVSMGRKVVIIAVDDYARRKERLMQATSR